MGEERPFPQSEQWRNLDAIQDPGSFVAYLDQAAAALRETRREVIQLLEVTSGCSVLDVGSGAGEFLVELAGSVDGVRAVGIDVSDKMVDTAAARARAAGVEITFVTGDAQRLDFPGESFDRVNCSRVLVHIEDPAAAIAEMARVLVPGGRVTIAEPDFDAFIIDGDDLAVTRAVRREMTGTLRNPDIGRRLRRLVIDCGLAPLDVSAVVLPVLNLQVALQLFGLFDHLKSAVRTGDITAELASRWQTWMETADATGRLLVAAVGFRVLANKPLR